MSTSRSRHRAPAPRPEDDARMDAALAGDGDLDSYLAALSAADAEHPTELTGRFGSAQVFQLRLPALRIEQLRRLAAERGVSPGALAVDWVIDRLDRESAAPSPATSPCPIQPRRSPPATQPPPPRPALLERLPARLRSHVGRRSGHRGALVATGTPERSGRLGPGRRGLSARHGLPVSAVTGTAAASAR